MKKHPGLIQDKKSGIFSFRKRVPEDLQPVLDKREINISFRTTDKKEAIDKYHVESLRWHNEFKRLRRNLAWFQKFSMPLMWLQAHNAG